MSGKDCPKCGKPSDWLSTWNEWEYCCKEHGRFNQRGEFMDVVEKMEDDAK